MDATIFNSGPMVLHGNPINGVTHIGTDQLYDCGSMYRTGDGRIYRYAKSNAEWRTGLCAYFGDVVGTTGIDYSVLPEAHGIGERVIAMTTPIAQTENGLRGGTIIINTVPPDAANALLQQRYITGNNAAAANKKVYIALDEPLRAAVTTASYAFCMRSPYTSVGYTTTNNRSVGGLPATTVTASGYFGWLMTRGFCWISDQAATLGTVDYQRQLVLGYAGGIGPHDSTALNAGQQHIGFIVDNNESHNGMTLIMLQID